MLNRVALALLAAVLPWGVVVPASAQTDEPLPIPPRHDLVGSLVGTRLDPAVPHSAAAAEDLGEDR